MQENKTPAEIAADTLAQLDAMMQTEEGRKAIAQFYEKRVRDDLETGEARQAEADRERSDKEAQARWIASQTDADIVKYYYENSALTIAIQPFLWGEDALTPTQRNEYFCRAAVAHKVNYKRTMFAKYAVQLDCSMKELRIFIERFATSLAFWLSAKNAEYLMKLWKINELDRGSILTTLDSSAPMFCYTLPAEEGTMYPSFNNRRLSADIQRHAAKVKEAVEGCKTAVQSAEDIIAALGIGHLIEKGVLEEMDKVKRSVTELQKEAVDKLENIRTVCDAYNIDITPADPKAQPIKDKIKAIPTYARAKVYKKVYDNNIIDYGRGMLDIDGTDPGTEKDIAYVQQRVKEYNEAKKSRK